MAQGACGRKGYAGRACADAGRTDDAGSATRSHAPGENGWDQAALRPPASSRSVIQAAFSGNSASDRAEASARSTFAWKER